MAGFDTFIQAGGAGINMPGIVNKAQVAKQNDLLNLGRQKELDEFDANAPVRAADRQDKLSDFERKSTIMGAKELSAYFDAADQAETPQQRLAVISKTLDFLDTRAANIKARGGDPSDTIQAKNALENYIANPTTGAEDFANVVNLTGQLAEMNVDDSKDPIRKVVEGQDGSMYAVRDSGPQKLPFKAARPDLKYHLVKWTDDAGNEHQRLTVSDPTNRIPSADGTVEDIWTPVEGSSEKINDIVNRLAPHQLTVENKSNQTAGSEDQPASQNGDFVSPVGGMAAQEAAKKGATLTEERFNKVITDAPQHTKMAGFIRQVSESVTKAATKARDIIKAHPNLAIGLGSQLGVVSTPDGGTRQRNLPGPWDEPGLELDTLMNQVFGGAAFATLQQMRQASPTGGALGQVSNFEIDLLQNQWAAFSQRTGNAEFAAGQMDEMIEQAQLVGDLANVEIGVQQRIQALGPDATKEDVAKLVNAGFKNMAEVYKRHGRSAGEWDEETLTWSPSRDTVSGESNKGKKDALDLTAYEKWKQENIR